ncbi:dynamin family protein [Sulfurospirillum sp. 1612]|uniref:dynamin family protein n=1 Tax=Sulfurospirillum sp. 1612 TaxID=3094835 RepID=UPI002F946BE8
MYILNDFFLLAWNEESDAIEDLAETLQNKIAVTYQNHYEDFCDSCVILFIINHDNIDKITQIDTFSSLFGGMFANQEVNQNLILKAQKQTLKFVEEQGNLELNQQIKSRFEILRKEGIISYYISRRLIGLFSLIKEKKRKVETLAIKTAQKDDLFYKNALNILNTGIENLKICMQDEYFINRLDLCQQKLKDEKLSIGITGVMNAGKSTMLNALLGEEILGTSVVPETANLTILKYDKRRHAKVYYWNQHEFEKIVESADDSPSIKKFVQETQEAFGDKLDDYITKSGKTEEIKIEDLHFYTSAKASKKKCNLVKSVDLYSDLEFLKDGVEIVDTPGLDDPIIQREEITLQYTLDCDLMIHLMNVNQSATKKDVDFIIDSIVYQNVARLLIVITRIDTVSEAELKEVVAYTKRGIKERLEAQNKSAKLQLILDKIDFIPISAKMALFHKQGKADIALEKGYDLEKTGLGQIEAYLTKVLFSQESAKASLVIDSNLIEILAVLAQSEKNFREEIELLGKSKEEIQEEFDAYQKQKAEHLSILEQIETTIKESQIELKLYFKTLEQFSHDALWNLKNIIKRRVVDDVSYELRKNKKLPKNERIEYFVQTGIKDGLVDLARDYRFEFQKKMQVSYEHLKESFSGIEDHDNIQNDAFDSQDFFDKYLKQFMIFQNSDALLSAINTAIKKYANKNLEALDLALDALLKEAFETIQISLDDRLMDLNHELLEHFVIVATNRVDVIKNQINMKDKIIQESQQLIARSSAEKAQKTEALESRLDVLGTIKKDLLRLRERVR